jgi:hypothetical protein
LTIGLRSNNNCNCRRSSQHSHTINPFGLSLGFSKYVFPVIVWRCRFYRTRDRARALRQSQRLPRPLKIPTVMTLNTLSDIRELMEQHLSAEYRKRKNWRFVEAQLNAAACGGDIKEAAIALRRLVARRACRSDELAP